MIVTCKLDYLMEIAKIHHFQDHFGVIIVR